MNDTLTSLRGVRVGHATRLDALTGATVVVFDRALPAAYVAYGGAAGTFNTDGLSAGKIGSRIHGIFVSGGSLTGLQVGAELIRCCVEAAIGFATRARVNPNVTGAIVLDLGMRRAEPFDPRLGREAFEHLSSDPVARGNVGAGTGTAVGKFRYPQHGKVFSGMKAGVGSACVSLGGDAKVCALTVVNALGNIIGHDGTILAGNRSVTPGQEWETFHGNAEYLISQANTTISIVGTNVDLKCRENYERVAHIATHGQVRAIDPVNLALDGDAVFVFSTEQIHRLTPEDAGQVMRGTGWDNIDVDIVGQAAARAVRESIYDGCHMAESVAFPTALDGVIPSAAGHRSARTSG